MQFPKAFRGAANVDLRRILALAKPERGRLIVATIALFISSGMTLIYPQAVRYLVDALAGGEAPFSLDTGALLLVAVFAVQAVFSSLRVWLFTVSGERIVARLRSRLFDAILHQDIAFFDQGRTGELTNRLASDTTVLQNTVTVNVSMGLRHSIGAVGGIVILIVMSPLLTGIAMAIVPVSVLAAAIYGRVLRRLSQQFQDALAASTAVAEEAIAGVRTVRSFAGEEQEVGRYSEAVDRSYQLAAKRAFAIGGFSGAAGFVGYAAIALVVWYGGHLVSEGNLTIGQLTAFLLYTGFVAVSFGALASLYGDYMRAIGASHRIFALLDQKPEIEKQGVDAGLNGDPATGVTGKLRFEGVVFSYPSRPDVVVLDELDLEIEPGEVVALVGPSGAGKSTVVSLIPRFYDPTGGRITLDGKDLRSYDATSLRHQIGAVLQEPVLFATTIAENIRYGRLGAADEEVRAAAATANAASFVEEFPDRYETLVGERGVRLSGGQKQRIAIARAVLKDPRILILDEATSALDAESEHLVREALERLMQGRTTLIIAHRLSTVRSADRVVVLEAGRAVESGNHEALMAANGLYRRLVERQFTEAA